VKNQKITREFQNQSFVAALSSTEFFSNRKTSKCFVGIAHRSVISTTGFSSFYGKVLSRLSEKNIHKQAEKHDVLCYLAASHQESQRALASLVQQLPATNCPAR